LPDKEDLESVTYVLQIFSRNMMFRRRWPEVNTNSLLTLSIVDAPLSKWPSEVQRLRKQVFPEWFASNWFPPLFRYRGWIITARINGRLVGFALADYFEDGEELYLEEVGVCPRCQNFGFGTTIALESLKIGIARGFKYVLATPLTGEDEGRRAEWLIRMGLPSVIGERVSISDVLDYNKRKAERTSDS